MSIAEEIIGTHYRYPDYFGRPRRAGGEAAGARAAQRQHAAGSVHQVGALARQAPRPAHLLPQDLGPDPAHLLAQVVDAQAPQRRDQLAGVAPAPARPGGPGLARIDGDDGHRYAGPARTVRSAWRRAVRRSRRARARRPRDGGAPQNAPRRVSTAGTVLTRIDEVQEDRPALEVEEVEPHEVVEVEVRAARRPATGR